MTSVVQIYTCEKTDTRYPNRKRLHWTIQTGVYSSLFCVSRCSFILLEYLLSNYPAAIEHLKFLPIQVFCQRAFCIDIKLWKITW